MAKPDQDQPTQQPVEESTESASPVQPAPQIFFFPPDFACEAVDLGEATRLYEAHKKGARPQA